MKERDLTEITRELLDLKKEKKDYNKEMNDRIKCLEVEILEAVKGE